MDDIHLFSKETAMDFVKDIVRLMPDGDIIDIDLKESKSLLSQVADYITQYTVLEPIALMKEICNHFNGFPYYEMTNINYKFEFTSNEQTINSLWLERIIMEAMMRGITEDDPYFKELFIQIYRNHFKDDYKIIKKYNNVDRIFMDGYFMPKYDYNVDTKFMLKTATAILYILLSGGHVYQPAKELIKVLIKAKRESEENNTIETDEDDKIENYLIDIDNEKYIEIKDEIKEIIENIKYNEKSEEFKMLDEIKNELKNDFKTNDNVKQIINAAFKLITKPFNTTNAKIKPKQMILSKDDIEDAITLKNAVIAFKCHPDDKKSALYKLMTDTIINVFESDHIDNKYLIQQLISNNENTKIQESTNKIIEKMQEFSNKYKENEKEQNKNNEKVIKKLNEEINILKNQINKKEREKNEAEEKQKTTENKYQNIYKKYEKLDNEKQNFENEKLISDSEKDELIKLRNYIYNLTLQDEYQKM